MNKPSVKKYFLNSNNYDEFIEKLTVANVEQEILEVGSFKGTASILISKNISVNNFIVNRKVLQKGTSIQGFITFTVYIPTVLFNWRKHDMKKGMIGVLWNREHESITGANFNAIPISIEENYFKKSCINKGFPGLIDLLIKNELLNVNEIELFKIRQLIQFILKKNDIEDSQLHSIMEIELVDLLIDCLSVALESEPTNHITNRNFYNIVDYINDHKTDLTSVSQICKNNNVTERTLRRWFRKEFAISPKQYMSMLRLNEVRKNLKNNSNLSSIQQIASEYNFWHMGQFSRDYKLLFNELPSKTLVSSR